jgi:ADP-heptose:LPS heptosyltransferase
MRRILVIRLGALGDFVLSFPAFAAIRAHHPADEISLLTTAPFAGLAADSPWFDRVLVDARPGWTDLAGIVRLRRQLRGHDFVYDLQTSGRSGRYFWLAGRPPWSGIARGCSHPDADPGRDDLHTVARQAGQLRAAGVSPVTIGPEDLGWLKARGPHLEGAYALVIPGTSASQGGAKRWPVERFAGLASALAKEGLRPVVVGGAGESEDARRILAECPGALDLTGQTSLQELAGLASRARVAIGGDTGPVHLAAMMGCPVVALFSEFSDPGLAAPVGNARIVRAARLEEVGLDDVLREVRQAVLF